MGSDVFVPEYGFLLNDESMWSEYRWDTSSYDICAGSLDYWTLTGIDREPIVVAVGEEEAPDEEPEETPEPSGEPEETPVPTDEPVERPEPSQAPEETPVPTDEPAESPEP